MMIDNQTLLDFVSLSLACGFIQEQFKRLTQTSPTWGLELPHSVTEENV